MKIETILENNNAKSLKVLLAYAIRDIRKAKKLLKIDKIDNVPNIKRHMKSKYYKGIIVFKTQL